jgi:hypothetical protein
MGTGDLINKLKVASEYLNNNGRTSEAAELDSFAKQLQDTNISKQKLDERRKAIISRCDMKWLGEIHIKEFKTPYEWWNYLGSIKTLIAKL